MSSNAKCDDKRLSEMTPRQYLILQARMYKWLNGGSGRAAIDAVLDQLSDNHRSKRYFHRSSSDVVDKLSSEVEAWYE